MNIEPDENGAAFWERNYAGMSRSTNGRPSPLLVRFLQDREPGVALDLGCARGDNPVWLARRGWTVTGMDVSETALRYASGNAEAAGVADRATFERHDLARTFPHGQFDLVTAIFLQSPMGFPRVAVLGRAAKAVRPGGLLLVTSHASVPPWSWADPDTVFPTPDEELAAIDLDEAEWTCVHVGAVEREANGPDGATATVIDNVVAIERR